MSLPYEVLQGRDFCTLRGRTFDDFLVPPAYSPVLSRSEINLETKITAGISLKFPVLTANMDTVTEEAMADAAWKAGGVGVIHRGMPIGRQCTMLLSGSSLAGAAVGVTGDYMERATALFEHGAFFILVDIAHAHSKVMELALKNLTKEFPHHRIMAGNIATYDGAKFLLDLGVCALKVGIGAGSACRTRLETGAGVGQLEAIRQAYHAVEGKIPIIADGGIRHDKDIFLSLAAGASTVMLGGMIAGTDEAPGELISEGMKQWKVYRGMASEAAQLARGEFRGAPEGQNNKALYKGPVKDIFKRIEGHLQSAISYAGCRSLTELHEKFTPHFESRILPISSATAKESFDR